jgi:hypothetical protein
LKIFLAGKHNNKRAKKKQNLKMVRNCETDENNELIAFFKQRKSILLGTSSPEKKPNENVRTVKSPYVSPLLNYVEESYDEMVFPVNPLLKAFVDVQNLRPLNAPFKSPLTEQPKRKGRKIAMDQEDQTKQLRPAKMNLIDHEAVIMSILSKKFVVPIANYIPEYTTKTLGMRKVIIRRALHDPEACNALILYAPTEADIKAAEKPKRVGIKGIKGLESESTVPIHVVVDPVLSNILRPHQREGVKFMYDCVTGVKGNFNGCIMADEMGKFLFN